MSHRRVSQIVLVVLTGVLLACGADQAVSPTAPDLGGASLTGEKKPVPADQFNYSLTFDGLVPSSETVTAVNLSESAIRVLGTQENHWLDIADLTADIDPEGTCFNPLFITHLATNVWFIRMCPEVCRKSSGVAPSLDV